jgi:ABC-2 type transport system ATP-binding protein
MSEILRLDGINKGFRGHQVLTDISFAIGKGKAVGLLGPNGVGKSTLLKIAVGLLSPDKGEVRIFGKPPSWQAFERVAFLPDRGHFSRTMKLNEALDMAGRLYPVFDLGIAGEILEGAKIPAQASISELSRGQEARLNIALCVARKPELLVLDEPFAGLDILSREAMVDAVIGAISTGVQSVLMSTHDLDDVEGVFDEIILLNDGRVALNQEAESVRAKYGSLRQMYKELMRL